MSFSDSFRSSIHNIDYALMSNSVQPLVSLPSNYPPTVPRETWPRCIRNYLCIWERTNEQLRYSPGDIDNECIFESAQRLHENFMNGVRMAPFDRFLVKLEKLQNITSSSSSTVNSVYSH